jgi:hypothetical protein
VLRNSYTLFAMGSGILVMSLLQIDTPEASVQVPRAVQNLRFLGSADRHGGMLESNYVAFVA